MSKKQSLHRSRRDRVLAGIAGGLADYLEVDATILRIGFILLFLFGGSGLLLYIILWILVPEIPLETKALENDTNTTAKRTTDEQEEETNILGNGFNSGGLILITIGALFLMRNLGLLDWFDFGRMWPLVLIVIGFAIIRQNK